MRPRTYHDLCEALREHPPGHVLRVPKDAWPDAPLAHWRRSVGFPLPETVRQFRDGVFHIHETVDAWCVHRDRVNPHRNPVGHLIKDCPRAFLSTLAAFAGVAGAVVAVRRGLFR